MTTDEIKALVAKKLAGQGTNVDAASVLPTIINALCDAVDAAAALAPKIITSNKPWEGILNGRYDTKMAFASALGIPESQVDDLPSCDELKLTDASLKRTFTVDFGGGIILFGSKDGIDNYTYTISIAGVTAGVYYIEKYY